jgi:hypothetical protein
MNLGGFAAPSRRGLADPVLPGKKIDSDVKLLLDNGGGKLYRPRLKKESPTLRG